MRIDVQLSNAFRDGVERPLGRLLPRLLDLLEQQETSCTTTRGRKGFPWYAIDWMDGKSSVKQRLALDKRVKTTGEAVLASASNGQPVAVPVEAGNVMWNNYKSGVISECPGAQSDQPYRHRLPPSVLPPAAPTKLSSLQDLSLDNPDTRPASPTGRTGANRRAPINDASVEPDSHPTALSPATFPKSASTIQVILRSLKGHYLFSSLGESEVHDIMLAMSNIQPPAQTDVIVQGSAGNCFYILESGTCEIYVNNEVVGQYVGGDAFGELALLYNCPRAATIRTITPCSLWTVDRTSFRKILATTASTMQLSRVQFLQNVELLQRLSHNQLQKVAAALKLEQFSDGSYIIKQGEEGHTFYIVVEGTVQCTTSATHDGVEKPLMTLTKGQYFGEMALMLNEPRQANCVAKGTVSCYVLGRQDFTNLLGPLRSLLDRQMRIRVLRSVPLLNYLTDDELDILAHALRVVAYEDKQPILRQGDNGDTFFIISDGKVCVHKSGVEIMTLRSGEFFGERALLNNEPRAADCVAVGRVECLCLDRSSFEGLLGKLEHIMARETKRQQVMQEAALATSTKGVPATPAQKKYRSLAGGMNDVVNHPWFATVNFDWKGLVNKTLRAPHVPVIKGAADVSNFDRCNEAHSVAKYAGQDYFEGF
ncbi:hypothetical protein B5M09_009822 [Aphanomyces astaci]|uniref:cGMP-dependent protein kinase n=1 Tax=Aphanomyces astaci TaxID=112090 RepID=A0A3R7WJ64_APHAT|nr:hypothetical protein B5M09_009822 [Aphanomyces astaci]